MLEALENLFQRLSGVAGEPIAMAVELILIALAINWCVAKLEGSRGTRPLRRLMLILLIVTLATRVLTDRFGWDRLEILYQYFVIAVAFIVLVAFQPELRRAFIRVGDVPLPRRQTAKARLINALVKSAGYLSRNKYGALVAIQRGVDLRGWAENGTMINAEVSANLLNSIFFPNSPLHDLGAVIADNRVVAANCQFPSAESEDIDTNLGSRHLAAVGLSYETDALLLVVSEETGTISIADNGKLTRYLSLDDLEHELEERLTGATAPETRRRQKSGWSLTWYGVRRALIVLALSVIVWYLADQAAQEQVDNVPVALRVLDPQGFAVEVVEPRPSRFTVKLRGSKRAIDQIRQELGRGDGGSQLRLEWPLPPIYASEGTPTIRAEDVLESVGWLSNLGVSVEDAQPEMIDLRVDKLVTEEVPVRVDSGNVLVSDVQLVPPTVSVTAPQRVFAATPTEERFLSVPLTGDLAGLPPGPFSKQNVGLRLALGGEPLAQVEPRAVDVSLNIVAETNEFVIEDVRIRLSFTPSFWQQYDQQRFRLVLVEELEWFVQELRVRSASRSIDQLTNADVDAYVLITSDVVNALGVERTLDVNMDLPRGVTLVGQPPQVRVRLEPVQP